MVPIEWLLGMAGLLMAGFLYWLREKFSHNDKTHEQIGTSVTRVEDKVDHIITHHRPQMPEFEE